MLLTGAARLAMCVISSLRSEVHVKRALVVGAASLFLTVPLVAIAEGSNMMGGERGAEVMRQERDKHGMASSRAATEMSEGEVRRVDRTAGKLTLRHGPLANLEMPAMTMVFRVKDLAWLAQLEVGDRVRFIAQRVDGNLSITALERQRK
jgi:Cu/Ag efflux protein CusF